MHEEISTLLGHLSKALEMEPEAVAGLLEQGALNLTMGTDEAGRNFVAVSYGDGADQRQARVYRDSIQHLGSAPVASASPSAPRA